MNHWIDALKSEIDEIGSAEAAVKEAQLRDARIIRDGVDEWFRTFVQCVDGDCLKLRTTFPDDKSKQLFIGEPRSRNGLYLNGGGLPRKILWLSLNTNALRIEVAEGLKQEFRYPPVMEQAMPIKITVGTEGQLCFTFMGRKHDTPESLSEHVVRYVAGTPARFA